MKNSSKKINIGLVIPARYDSSRLPGKPLIDILGKSLIQRTWEQCCKALPSKDIYVATDSPLIKSHVTKFGGQVIMTSAACSTGTDRVAEANDTLSFDIVINVQGDEPIIDPMDITKVIQYALNHPNTVINGMGKIINEEEFRSTTIPKVVTDNNNKLLYISRCSIPGSKNGNFTGALKQVCIYSFPKDSLLLFGKGKPKSKNEDIEDIEILRFLDNGLPVSMLRLSGKSIAVDVESDLKKVKQFLLDDCIKR
jgi:3-deoxy-manno-octulosonate cytidylyltransferase (CMP-KDO synthetase)